MKQQPKQSVAKPTHRIYLITGEGKSAFWTPIGAAWPNRDGEGFSIRLDATPVVPGRTVMRRITVRAVKGTEAA